MVSGLRDPSVAWTPEQTAEALLTVDEETDRLNQLVGNLLDASRLQIGALAIDVRPADVAEIVAAAMRSISAPSGVGARRDPGRTSRRSSCDSTLLERSLANIIAERAAVQPARHTGDGSRRPRSADRVHLRVIDRGIGIKPDDRAQGDLAVPALR